LDERRGQGIHLRVNARCPAYKNLAYAGWMEVPSKATLPANDMDSMALLRTFDEIKVFVGGGKGGTFIGLYMGARYGGDLRVISKKIDYHRIGSIWWRSIRT